MKILRILDFCSFRFPYVRIRQDAEFTGSGAEVTASGAEATGSSAEATGSVRTMEPAGSDVDLVRTETSKKFASRILSIFFKTWNGVI